jgi:uncharacterized membrane protein YdfJ with MMPL/SSD domain
MKGLARWCIAHRRTVIVGWVVVLIAANAAGLAAGSSYNSNFKGPSTSCSQLAINLLTKDFPQRRGDQAAIVFESKAPIVS